MEPTKSKCKGTKDVKGAKKYPGVAIDIADNEKVDAKLVKDQTAELNNGPEF